MKYPQGNTTRLFFLCFSALLLLSAFDSKVFSQATVVPVGNVPPAMYDAGYAVQYIRHETDAQTQILVPLQSALTGLYTCNAACAATNWSVTIGGVPATISSVVGAIGSTSVTVSFTPAVGIGQAVLVSYSGGGALLNNFTNRISYNARPIVCNDFAWESTQRPTLPCAPVTPNTQLVYSVKPGARNSQRWNFARVTGRTSWITPGAAPFTVMLAKETDNGGTNTPNSYYVGFKASDFTAGSNPLGVYTYPANDPVCGYSSTWNVRLVFAAGQGFNGNCPLASAAQTIVYSSFNNDATGPGAAVLLPPTIANSDKVCLGTNVNMTFSDATDLNCNPAVLPGTINDKDRWVRVVYGPVDGPTGNIPNILVGGVPVTDAAGTRLFPSGYFPVSPTPTTFGTPDAFGVVAVPESVLTPRGILELITTSSPVGQVVGQRFTVRLDYWNPCNAYDGVGDLANVRRSVTAFVEIIGSPNAPVITVSSPFCETASDASFNVTATGTGSGALTYTWYKDAALTTTLQAISADNTFNPVTEGPAPDRIAKAVAASSTFNRFVTVTQGSNNCTSPPATVTIRIDDTNTPGAIGHPLGATPITFCSGTDPASFTSATDATGGGPGATPTYQWQSATNSTFTAGLTNVGTNSNVFDPGAISSNLFFRRTASSGACATVNSNTIEFRVDTPVTGGTINSVATICETPGDPANITNATLPTGGSNTGAYTYQWQSSTTAVTGPFTDIGGANGTSYNPPAGVIQTTYYRRRVTSGVCSSDANTDGIPDNVAFSNVVTVTVNNIVNPGIIGNPQTICSGQDPAALTASVATGGNGTTYTYLWKQSTTSNTGPFSNASGMNNTQTYDPPVLTQTTWYIRNTTSGVCSSVDSNVIEVTVNPLPTAANPTGGGAVCGVNPAPDINWTLTGTAPFNVTYTQTPGGPVVVNAWPTTTFTISSPAPGVNTTYQITSLTDANGCVATSMGSTAAVTIGGTAPAFDTPLSLIPSITCDAGASTTDPSLNFSLTPASTSAGNYTLTYKVNGGSNQTKTFSVILGNGDPSSAITFTEAALNSVATHTITIVSILTPTGCITTFNTPLSFTVRALPAITTQPANASICSLTNTTFSVVATGTDLSYQWQERVGAGAFTNIVNGGVYSGATTAALTLTGATLAMNTNQYRVIVTGYNPPSVAPLCPVTSNAATLTVNAFATITTQPANASQCVGLNRNFSITASGPGIAYQWQISTNGGGSFSDLTNVAPYSNVTTSTLTITGVTAGLNNNQYRARLTTTGSCSINSNAGILTVNPLPTALVITPQLCDDVPGVPFQAAGKNLSTDYSALVSDAIGSGGTVDWYNSSADRTAGINKIVAPVTISTGQTFFFRATSAAPFNCINDGSTTFTVNALPAAVDKSGEFCENTVGFGSATGINLATFEMGAGGVTSGGTNVTRDVEWYEDDGFGGLGTLISSGVALGQEQNYSISATKIVHAKVIDLTSSVTPKCFDIADVTLKFKKKPIDNPITGNASVCTDANLIQIYQVNPSLNNYSNTGVSPTVHTYTWTVSGTADFTVVAGGGTNSTNFFVLIKFPGPTTGTVNFTVFETIDGCSGNTSNFVTTISGAPGTLTFNSPATQVCKNQSGVTYSLTSSNPSSVYTWNVVGGAVVGANSGPGLSSITVNWGSLTLPQPTVTVTETSSSGCPGSPASINVFLNDVPAMTSASSYSMCSGFSPATAPVPLNFVASIPSTFSWKVLSVTGAVTTGGLPVVVGSTGSGNINQVLSNKSGSIGSVTYEVIPSESGLPSPPDCAGTPQTVVVTVNPEPVLVVSQATTICSGQSANYEILLTPANLPALTTFTWADPDGAGPASGTIAPVSMGVAGTKHITDVLTNSGNTPIITTYSIVPLSGAGCTGTSQNVAVTIEPVPTAAILNTTPVICNSGAVSVDISSPTIPTTPANLKFDVSVSSTNAGATGGTAFTNLTNQTFPLTINGTLTNSSSSVITVTYSVTPKLTGCSNGTLQTTTIKVEPTPSAVINNLATDLCSNDNTNIQITSPTVPNTVANLRFDLAVSSTNALATGGSAFANLTNQSFPLTISGNLTNSSNAPITVTYTVTPKLSGCANGTVQTTTVVVEPVPSASVNNSTATVCESGSVNIVVASTSTASVSSNLKFDVAVSSTNAGATGGTAFTSLSNQSYPLTINGTLTNSSNGTVTVTYTVTPKLTGCANGTPIVTTVVVEPTPQAAVNNTAPGICNGGNVNLAISSPTVPSNVGNLKFDLGVSSSNPGVTSGSAFTNLSNQNYPLSITGSLSNSGNSSITVTFTITPKLNGCPSGTPIVTAVVVEPTPKAAITNTTPLICTAGSINLNITSATLPTVSGDLKFNVAVSSTNTLATGGTAFAALTNQSFPLSITGTLTNSSTSSITVTYTVTPTLNGCANGPVQTTTVTVEPTPQAAIANASPTICNGGAVSLNISSTTAPSIPANLGFDLAVSSTNAGATGGTAFTALANQTFPLTINGTLTNSSSSSIIVTYTVTPKLTNCANGPVQTTSITIEPTPLAVVTNTTPTICESSTVNISLTSPSSPSTPASLTFDVSVVSSNAAVTGGTAFTNINSQNFPFTINGTLTNSSNSPVTVTYSITPKIAGCASGVTQTTSVTVEPAPSAVLLNSIPTICNNGNISIGITTPTNASIPANLRFDVTVASSNTPATGGTSFVALSNQNFPLTLSGTLTNSSNSVITVTYTVTPKLVGCASGSPQITTVFVEPTPQAALVNSNSTICNGDNVSILITSPSSVSNPGNLKFDVAVSSTDAPATGGSAFAALSGQIFPLTLNGVLTNSSNANITVTYTITPTLNGCANGSTKTTTVVVEPTPQLTITNLTSTICTGGNVNLSFATTSAPTIPANLKFDLVVSSSDTGATGGGAFNSITNQSFPLSITGSLTNSSNSAITVTYTATPILNGCANGPPQVTTVVVEPTPQAAFVNGSPLICNGDNTSIQITTPSVVSNSANLKFDVVVLSTNLGATGGTAFSALTNQSFPFTINGTLTNSSDNPITVTFQIIPKLTGCASGSVQTTTIQVEPTPQSTITNSSATICNNGNVNINITSPSNPTVSANLQFDMTVSSTNLGATSGTAFVPLTNQSFPLVLSGVLSNSSSSSVTVTYNVTPKLNGCPSGPVQTTTVVVEPTPQALINNTTGTICSSDNVNLQITSPTTPFNLPNLNFDVAVASSNTAATSGTAFVALSNQSFPLTINGTILNTSDAPVTITYTVIPKLNGCANGPTQTTTVTVEPVPRATLTNSASTICNGSNVNILVASPSLPSVPANLSFDVAVSSTNNGAMGGTAFAALTNQPFPTTLNGILTNSSSSAVTVTFSITPKLAGCADGTVQTTTVVVEPTPNAVVNNLSPTICNGNNVNLNITTLATPSMPSNQNFDVAVSSSNMGATGGTAFTALTNQSFPLNITGSLTNSSNSSITITYTITPKLAGCANGLAQTATVVVEPTPNATIANTTPVVCNGGNVSINVSTPSSPSVPSNLKYDVAVSSSNLSVTGGTAFAPLLNQNFPSTISGTLTNSGNSFITITFTVTPKLSGCTSGPVQTTTVRVEPTPSVVIVNNKAKVCNTESPDIDVTSSTVPTNLTNLLFDVIVTSTDPGNLSGAASNDQLNVSAPFSINATDGSLINASTSPITVTYTITPKLTGCIAGTPVVTSIILEPTPVIVAVNNLPAICSGASPNIVISSVTNSSVVADQKFDIAVSSSNIGSTSGTAFVSATDVTLPFTLNTGTLINSSTTDITVTFTFTPKLAGCPNGSPITVNVVVHPVPTVVTTSGEICSNNVPNVTFTSPVAGSSFSWIVSSISGSTVLGISVGDTGNTNTVPTLIRNVTSSQAQITFTVTPTGPALLGGCVGPSKNIVVKVNPEPVMLNPGLDKITCSDAATGLVLGTNGVSVSATSYRVTTFNLNGLTESPSNLLKTSTILPLTISANQLALDKFTNTTSASVDVEYTVVPVGPAPSLCSGDPLVVRVTVKPEPIIVPGAVPVCSGEMVGASITLGPAVGSVTPDQYELKKITNVFNMPTGGSNAGLGVYNNGTFLANDVYINNIDGNSHDVVYEVVPITAGCRGEDALGGGKLITLTVNPAPDLLDGISRTVCSGDLSGLMLATRALPVASALADHYIVNNIQVDGGLVVVSANLAFPRNIAAGDLAADQFSNPTNNKLTVTYTVIPVTLAGCKGVAEDVVLTIEPTITMIVPPNATICSDTPNSPSTTNILLDSNTVPSSGVITFNYFATSSPAGAVTGFTPVPLTGLTKFTVIADKLVNSTNNPATVTYTITPVAASARGGLGCTSPTSTQVVITVEPKPKLSITPSTQTVCEAVSSAMKLTSTSAPSSGGTIQFDLISSVKSDPSLALLSVPKAVYLNNESVTDIWDNPTSLPQTVTYTFRAKIMGGSGLGCTSEDLIAVLTVNPRPTIIATPANTTICSSDFVNITLSATDPNYDGFISTYTASDPSGKITGETNGAGNVIFQTLFYNSTSPTVANSDAPVTVTYTVTPKLNGCAGPDVNIPVLVNPKPKINGPASTYKVCHNNSLVIPLSSNVVGTNYTWTVENLSGLPGITDQTTPVSATDITQLLLNTTGVQASLTYTIKAFGPGANPNDCEGDQKIVIVTVAPEMNATFQNTSASICKGSSEFLIIAIDGQAPFSFTYNEDNGTTNIDKVVNGAGNFKVIQVNPTMTTTYTIKSIKDAFNCPLNITGQAVTITVGDTDPAFTVVEAPSQCSPFQYHFQYNQKAGTQYTWQWQDGSSDSTYLATTDVPNQIVPHTFANLSPSKNQDYNVTMRVELPAPFPGCFKFSTKKVTIKSIIITNVPDVQDVCSGESVTFRNQSLGVTSHKWFWRLKGDVSGTENEVKTTSTADYTFTSSTSVLGYEDIEVVYRANNGGNCPAPEVIKPIRVFTKPTASFNEGTIPLFNSGSATVTFTNTTTPAPINFTQFRHEWSFGITNDANPATLTQTAVGGIPVTYSSPGTKDVSLGVINVVAETAGVTCRSDAFKSITIILPPLDASFDVSPKKFCFPGNIKLMNVVGTGFVHEWFVTNKKTGVSSTYTVANPGEFKISEPGTYLIRYKTSIPQTGQVKIYPPTTDLPLEVEVFDVPMASFDLRPDVVFVPDTQLETFNFSDGATGYRWNFGDTPDFVIQELGRPEPKYTYAIEGKYDVTLIAENDHGGGVICRDTLVRPVIAKQGGQSKIPNAFTPNTNGPSGGNGGSGTFNDVFLPIVKGVPADADAYNLQIFDRWGNLIFESSSSSYGWDGYNKDGKLMPSGVYVYKLTVRFSDSQRTTQVGDITMIY